MPMRISESGTGECENMIWEVYFGNDETRILYYIQNIGNSTKSDVYEIRLGQYSDMREIINNDLFNKVPDDYIHMIGDSLASLQRVFNATKEMKK